MASEIERGGPLFSLYRSRIGTPTTDDEVRGYWVFLLGLLLGLVGMALFAFSESAVNATGITLREVSVMLLAVGLAMLVAGPVIRLPLQPWANYVTYAGQGLCLVAVAWFSVVFPADWNVMTGNQPVILLYAAGLGLIAVGGAIVPLVAGVTREDLEASEHRAAELESKLEAVRTERDSLQAKLQQATETSTDEQERRSDLQERLDAVRAERDDLEQQLSDAEAASDAGKDRESDLQEELADVREERDRLQGELRRMQDETEASEAAQSALKEEQAELNASIDQLETSLESLRRSEAQFELYEDSAGKYRWRLRHRNGNVIATGGQGYTRKHNAQKGVASVQRNALGGAILHVVAEPETEPEEALEATPLIPEVEESRAEFDLYEDSAGKYRWRLVHDNGNIIADSGEGYASKQKAKQGLDSVRNNADLANYLQFDPTSFEVYRDKGGAWRWRLVHKNGNIVATASEGYSRRRDAKRSVDAIRDSVADTDGFEVYQDNRGEYRWRLRAGNSEIIATSGEGYASKSGAEDAVERIRRDAPDADALDVGFAAFEVYKDSAEEWRWRLRHRNGNVVADSGEGYASRTGAQEGIESVKRNAPTAEIAS